MRANRKRKVVFFVRFAKEERRGGSAFSQTRKLLKKGRTLLKKGGSLWSESADLWSEKREENWGKWAKKGREWGGDF